MYQQPISLYAKSPSLQRGSLYGIRLIQLHGARWRLMARMEDEQERSGLATAELEADLASNHAKTRTFLAYLSAHD